MIRLLMPLLLGLLMGTGLGTGLFIMRGGSDEPALTEHVEGDSLTHAEGEVAPPPHDSTEAEAGTDHDPELAAGPGVEADTTHSEGPEPTSVDPEVAAVIPQAGTETTDPDAVEDVTPITSDPTPAAAAGATAVAAPQRIEPIPGANLSNNVDAAKRLAKIFSTMQARDAAKVLSLMDPSEMELVLRQLDNRSAAKILAGLDAPLAAQLSQALMRPGGDR